MRRVENRKQPQPWGVIYRLSRRAKGAAYAISVARAFTHEEMQLRESVAMELRVVRRQLGDFVRDHYPAVDFRSIEAATQL